MYFQVNNQPSQTSSIFQTTGPMENQCFKVHREWDLKHIEEQVAGGVVLTMTTSIIKAPKLGALVGNNRFSVDTSEYHWTYKLTVFEI
jgi:hypothetical protein